MSSTDDVVFQISRKIRDGHYAPGQRLIESDLVDEFGARRSRVREALRVLAGEGLVEIVPQRGARVRRLRKEDLAEMMPVLGGLLGVTIDLAMPRLASSPFRERLEKYMADMRQQAAAGNSLGFHHVSAHYSRALDEAADNRFLDYLKEKIHGDIFRNQFFGNIEITNWQDYLKHFEDMHAALIDGDGSRARELIMEHQERLLGGYYNQPHSKETTAHLGA